jgi:hypothetical protein
VRLLLFIVPGQDGDGGKTIPLQLWVMLVMCVGMVYSSVASGLEALWQPMDTNHCHAQVVETRRGAIVVHCSWPGW